MYALGQASLDAQPFVIWQQKTNTNCFPKNSGWLTKKCREALHILHGDAWAHYNSPFVLRISILTLQFMSQRWRQNTSKCLLKHGTFKNIFAGTGITEQHTIIAGKQHIFIFQTQVIALIVWMWKKITKAAFHHLKFTQTCCAPQVKGRAVLPMPSKQPDRSMHFNAFHTV